MENSFIGAILELLESTFGYAVGAPEFNLALGVSMAAWVFAARLFMVMFSTRRGIVAAFLACVVSLVAGLCGYVGVEHYVLPLIEANWADVALPIAGLFGCILLSVLAVTKQILKLSAGGTIFIYVVATMVAVCAHFGVQIALGLVDAGSGQVEQREQRMQERLESIY